MADHSSLGEASFWTQSKALFRKNLNYQKRKWVSNIVTIVVPILLCLSLSSIEKEMKDDGHVECGLRDLDGVAAIASNGVRTNCPISKPTKWPPMLQIPDLAYRDPAVTGAVLFVCKSQNPCLTTLLTSHNHSLGESLGRLLYPSTSIMYHKATSLEDIPYNVLGSQSELATSLYYDNAFSRVYPLYNIQRRCSKNSSLSIPSQLSPFQKKTDVVCLEARSLWRSNSSVMINELINGHAFEDARKEAKILAAYDFLNTSEDQFNVSILFKPTKRDRTTPKLQRLPRSVNIVTNAYLEFLKGPNTKILLEFVSEIPKPLSKHRSNLTADFNTIVFAWLYQLLLPVILGLLVYEKQKGVRVMMALHALGDASYISISYSYFLFISMAYFLLLLIFGSLVFEIDFFRVNNFLIHIVFSFVYANLQISMAFLGSTIFKDASTATVLSYMFVIANGLVGLTIFDGTTNDISFTTNPNPNPNENWIIALEFLPCFALYRGLNEFSEYTDMANYRDIGMTWRDLSDGTNGMKTVILIMIFEGFIFLAATFYIVLVGKSPINFLQDLRAKKPLVQIMSFSGTSRHSDQSWNSTSIPMETQDVTRERHRVEKFFLRPNRNYSTVCYNLTNCHQELDGDPLNPDPAVNGLSLAVTQGECFGIVGPNRSGKSSLIHMMTGLTRKFSGTALVQGIDIRAQRRKVQTSIGVCLHHDALWETLTPREHLLFYGRLKNLSGLALNQAVEESLKGVNLNYNGVPDKQTRHFSVGMKRRLSIAISLLGDPKIVFMDEPANGIDPYSRTLLWNVVKRAKYQGRTIFLATHSMKEAEVVCDRIGIFVDGRLQCVGNPKELKRRLGDSYVLTMSTSPENVEDVEKLVTSLTVNAIKVFHNSVIGRTTQKFELAKTGLRIGDVFKAVEGAKRRFTVTSWSLADTNLEDLFVNVTRKTQAYHN